MTVETFRVYPSAGRLHFDVYLWPTLKAMRQFLMGEYPRRGMSRVLACVIWPTNASDRPRRDFVAEIHFNRAHLTEHIVAHEATPAALLWAHRVGLDVKVTDGSENASAQEERFCDALGALTQQILVAVRQ